MCSLEPKDFHLLVERIRTLEVALGKSVKKVQESELACYTKLGKTLVVTRTVSKGHRLLASDLLVKVAEPKGIDGSMIEEVIGRIVNKSLEEDQSLCSEDLED